MAINTNNEHDKYRGIALHVGHDIVCVTYGLPHRGGVVACNECETCGEVLFDADAPEEE